MLRHARALCAISLSSATLLHVQGAVAADDLLETLAQKGVISMEEYDKLRARQPKPGVTLNTDDGFKLSSADGASTFQVGVLEQLDYAAYHSDGPVDLSDGTELRRSRLAVSGQFQNNWLYRVEYEFATNATANSATSTSTSTLDPKTNLITTKTTTTVNSTILTGITDVYVSYTGFKPVNITVGQFKPPFSMEALMADKNATFMERGLPFYLLSPLVVRAPGAAVGSSGDHWSLTGGVFGEPLGNPQTGDEGWGAAARATYAPIASSNKVLHFGVGVLWHDPTQGVGAGSSSSLQLRAKPESNELSQRFVDTGVLSNVTDFRFTGLELAGEYGPASLQGEYDFVNVGRNDGSPDQKFSSYYLQAAYTLTGEVRSYKVDKGIFDGIRPAHNLGKDGGWGAFEVAARISSIDLNDGALRGGRERNATGGVSWYMNQFVRLSANYVKVLKIDGGSFDGEKPSIYEMRLQLAI